MEFLVRRFPNMFVGMSDERRIQELEEQLKFARQKASLYYITVSELDALKRKTESFVETKDACTITDHDLGAVQRVSVETQTIEKSSAEIEAQTSLELAQTEVAALRQYIDTMKRTEAQRLRASSGPSTGCSDQVLAEQYSALLEEFLKQNKLSVNHSLEIKRRDEMISSLFEKIRTIEDAFSKKLSETSRLAESRQEVIHALSQQVKDAVTLSGSEPPYQVDYRIIASMQSEMEDLRAELSMARTNWAATKEELARLQFRVGADGNGGDVSPQAVAGFPSPIVDIIEKSTGTISSVRSIAVNRQS
jgi:hypothetical protein